MPTSYATLTHQAFLLLQQASRLPGLTKIEREQATAACKLAGVTLHKITLAATSNDAAMVRKDLEFMWRAVDPLILAIGEELAQNFHGIDLRLFEDQLCGSLEGNATHACDEAERRAIEARFGDVLPKTQRELVA